MATIWSLSLKKLPSCEPLEGLTFGAESNCDAHQVHGMYFSSSAWFWAHYHLGNWQRRGNKKENHRFIFFSFISYVFFLLKLCETIDIRNN